MAEGESLDELHRRMTERSARVKDTHRAIGGFVVAFSDLIASMRQLMESRLRRDDDAPELMQIVLGGLDAGPTAVLFFALCERIADLADDEREILKRLREKVRFQAIEKRNDIAHGDWWIETPAFLLPPGRAPTYYTRTDTRTAQPRTATSQTPDELDKSAEALYRLRSAVWEFGALCFGTHPLQREGPDRPISVSDILTMRGTGKTRRVYREGPLASEGSPGVEYPEGV